MCSSDLFWTLIFSFKLEATVRLRLSIRSIMNSLAESLERFGGSWKCKCGFVGGITSGTTDVDTASRLGDLQEVLDRRWELVVQHLLDGFEVLGGSEWNAFTDEGNSVHGAG